MPVPLEIVNRNNIYTEIYFKMQYAILPMSLGQMSRCSRSLDISAHNNFGPCQFRPISKSAYTISAHKV